VLNGRNVIITTDAHRPSLCFERVWPHYYTVRFLQDHTNTR